MGEPKLIYIAAPYSSPWPWVRARNILRSLKAAVALAKKGHIPFSPHAHTCLWWVYGWGLSWQFYIDMSLHLVRRCDWFLYLEASPGADRELAEAKKYGKPVFYSVEEVPEVCEH